MSDNFHDAFEEGIRDNAGHLALAGALFAHSQRKQQLQSLEASRQHQAEIAKTEAQRLEIEKQRLELEKLKQQAEKDEKEAVRLLRVMMAEVGAEFDGLANRGQLKGSPQGPRRDYAMTVLMSKLELVRSRSSSLSDLNDLKELSRLENLVQDLVAKHFLGGDPLLVTRNKWSQLQAWMQGVEGFEKEVKQACAVVPDPTVVQLPSLADLVAWHPKLEAFADQLAPNLSEHVHRLPAEALVDGVLLGELVEQAQLEDLSAGKQASRAKSFANRWRQAATAHIAKEPGMLVTHKIQPGLVQEVQSAIERLQQWQDRAVDHEKTLQDLRVQLEEGRLTEAEASAKKLGKVRFAELNYQPISEWEKLDGLLDSLPAAKRSAAIQLATDLRKTYLKAANQSELGRLLDQHEKRALGEKRRAVFTLIMVICLVASAFKVGYDNHLEHQRLVAEAKVKAEEEQKQRERIAAQAKSKADAEQKARERSAAEAKAKADGERRELSEKLQATAAGTQVNILLTDTLAQGFALMPNGSFTMGSPSSEDDHSSDENQVEVSLRQPFWLAKTEVTQAQWEAVTGSNPSTFKGTNLPVENVSWEDVQAFIEKLNEKQSRPQGWKFALPTEAQWEYACRAGEKGPFSGGSPDDVSWHYGNSGGNPYEVGQNLANVWGLYDMHGNVWEWCSDWYDGTLKRGTDPVGPYSGEYRVFRGGSWRSDASYCRAASRGRESPGFRGNHLGFRLALVASR